MENDIWLDLSPRYKFVRTLGRGTFGHVVLAQDTAQNNAEVAIKLFERGILVNDILTNLEREIMHHASMSHPFVVSLYGVCLTQKHLCLVMEPGISDLSRYLADQPEHRVPEHTARYFIRQLAIGLDYVHARGVANRDIKLENLIMTSSGAKGDVVLKISDFGYSKHLYNNSTAISCVGTIGYIAPEIIIGGIAYNAHSTDIWSVGVILYKLVTGKYPFDTHSRTHAQDVINGKYDMIEESLGISSELKDLIHRLLEPLPRKRITMAEILQHPWFTEGFRGGDLIHANVDYLKDSQGISEENQSKISALLRLACHLPGPEEEITDSMICMFR